MTLTKEQTRRIIAHRVAGLLHTGDIVTLGIGLPTSVAEYIPDDKHIILHSENGLIGMGGSPAAHLVDPRITNSGGVPASIREGGCFFDSSVSFAIIRGGHIDATVLGALQVDEVGNIANWLIPGKLVPGMGGAMDLVVGAKQVIIAMEHTNKGKVKILKRCTLPLTAAKEANIIVTELGVMHITDNGIVLTEINPMVTVEDVQHQTEARLTLSPDLKEMILPPDIDASNA